MGVLYGHNVWPDAELIGRPCFYCNRPIDPPAVYWHGCGESDDTWLVLHPGCAIDLFVRLARDVLEVEHRTRYCVTVERWRHLRQWEELRQ